MNRTLSLSISLTLIVIFAMAMPARSGFPPIFDPVVQLLTGKQSRVTQAGVTSVVDEQVPAIWLTNPVLAKRYNTLVEGKTGPIYRGTILSIGAMLQTDTRNGRDFVIAISDPTGQAEIPKDAQRRFPHKKLQGMRVLKLAFGIYAQATLDTNSMTEGSYFIYIGAQQVGHGRRELYSELVIPFRLVPPLPDVLPAMQDASEEILQQWGLESYPTVREVTRQVKKLVPDTTPSRFDVIFNDGGRMRGVSIAGTPQVGRVLGIFSPDALLVPARVNRIDGNIIYVDVTSDCLRPYAGRENQIILAWVSKVYKYQLTGTRKLDAQQMKNLMTYPDGPVGSPTFGLRNMMYEMATSVPDGPLYDSQGRVLIPDTVVHLRSPFVKNTSWIRQFGNQINDANHFHWMLAPNLPDAPRMIEAYIPEVVTETIRCVRLAIGGVPVVKVDQATSQYVFEPGIATGAGMLLGQLLRKPDNTNISANATGGKAVNKTAVTTVTSTSTNVGVNTGNGGTVNGSAGSTGTGTSTINDGDGESAPGTEVN